MRVGEYKIRLRIVLLLLLVLPGLVFVYLGIWQLERAEVKRMQAESLQQRESLPALQLQELLQDPESARFRQVEARGEFLANEGFLIENRRYAGKTGFFVITPLRLADSDIQVLVNRGWVAADARNQPPAIETPSGEVLVKGTADIPSAPALSLHGDSSVAKQWGKRWPYMTLELYAGLIEAPLQGISILQDPDNAHGFTRDWPREMPKEGMHLGYAIQWFAFAAVALGFYFKLSLEKVESENNIA